MPTIINACLGILIQSDLDQPRVLLAQRPPGKVMAGYWEFPGGKIEAGETILQALQRELAEELGITVSAAAMEMIGSIEHSYSHGLAMLSMVKVTHWNGELRAREGQTLVWQELNAPILLEPLLPTTEKIFSLLKA
jgi:8-oxo-dGTP diphosphatase